MALIASAISIVVALRLDISGITHIKRIDTAGQPRKYTNALNVLLLGSDTRTGRNAAIGGQGGCDCSDTIMVAHISPGRQSATVLSIPRDTVVPYYKCAPWRGLPGQDANPYAFERINATLAAGGPECVRETVEQQTGIYIDYVIQLNFVGFQKVITAVGGVNVCLPFAIDNKVPGPGQPGSGLDLSAGWHHLSGHAALQYWRTRYNVADGSDLARIARDQYLMAQIVKGVLRSGLLHSPTKLYTVIGDVADAMTTDASDTELLHIALSLHGLSPKNIQFLTSPWTSYPYDPNEVQFAQPQANAVFWAIAHDTALPPSATKPARRGGTSGAHRQSSPPVSTASTTRPTASPSASPTTSPSTGASRPPSVNPSLVHVTVLDGSSRTDRVARAAAELTSRGFDVLGTGYAPTMTYKKTVIEYASAADLPAAMTLKAQFFPVVLKRVAGLTAGTVQVILGSTFTMLAAPGPTSQSSLHSLHNNYGGITANVRCRNSAFYGTFDQSSHSNPCTCGS